MMGNVNSYKLSEIAKWQLDSNNASVELPALQRAFVWKPNQIESLWDSLLRGFPVGSFLFSMDDDGKYFILDGQQRATSIALGFYNPWEMGKEGFWSLRNKNVPVLWIDLAARKDKNPTQEYVLKLVTQSHPWGYQTAESNKILALADRREAIEIFRENPKNDDKRYTLFSSENVFPYDSHLPVPLSFLISSIEEKSKDWKNYLLELCEKYLPYEYIRTKGLKGSYLEKLKKCINDDKFSAIYKAIENLDKIEIPAIITSREILESDNEQESGEPILFERLNRNGTQIGGEELLYSLFKASFPDLKELVENVGLNFIAPSRIISLTVRLVIAEMKNEYPHPITIDSFRKNLRKGAFKKRLVEIIGKDEKSSPIKKYFEVSIDILRSEDKLNIPPALVKNLITKDSSELLLLLLQWLRVRKSLEIKSEDKKRILAVFTALSWFGVDNTSYVREIWHNFEKGNADKIWTKDVLNNSCFYNGGYIMYPLVKPDDLRDFLIKKVVAKKILWNELWIENNDTINKLYNSTLNIETKRKNERQEFIRGIWGNFINQLVWNKSMLLFAQRDYINDNFSDFNQMETLEDTNTPWDWDHIYPNEWVRNMKKINGNVKSWSEMIGNFRAISLEDNRKEGNRLSPFERLYALYDVRKKSFVKYDDKNNDKNDWQYWERIKERIMDVEEDNSNFLRAVIHRLCNIYEEWYTKLHIGELFPLEKETSTKEENPK